MKITLSTFGPEHRLLDKALCKQYVILGVLVRPI